MSTAGSGNFVLNSKWVSGVLYFYEKAVGRTSTGDVLSVGSTAVTVGGTGQDVDFAVYGTGSKSFVIDIGGGTVKSTMALLPTSSDGAALGSASLMWSDLFLASGGVINFNNGDVTLTHASNALALAGGCLNLHTSGSPYAFTAGTPAFTLYTSNNSTTSTNAEPFLVYNTQSGTGGVGGRAKFYLSVTAALGSYSNALKAQVVYANTGRTTGMGSAFCAELELSTATTQGNYAPVEAELVANTGDSTGTATGFFYCNADGTGEDTILDSNANLFIFGDALDAASGKFIDTDISSHTAYGGIRINIEGVGTKYLAVVSD